MRQYVKWSYDIRTGRNVPQPVLVIVKEKVTSVAVSGFAGEILDRVDRRAVDTGLSAATQALQRRIAPSAIVSAQ